jgi:hypothetical protein
MLLVREDVIDVGQHGADTNRSRALTATNKAPPPHRPAVAM